MIERTYPPFRQDQERIVVHSLYQTGPHWILQHITDSRPVIFIMPQPVIVVTRLPDRCLNSSSRKLVRSESLQHTHQRRQCSVSQLTDQVQMVWHYDSGIDSKQLSVVHPSD